MAPPSMPDQFPSKDMFDTLVRIEVGSDFGDGSGKQTFEIFKGVLCFYSGYFNASLNGPWIEARDHINPLPTEDPKIFELFKNWIHTRRFYESTLEPSVLMDFITLAKLWVFADAHDVPMLQNEAVNLILKKMNDSKTIFSTEAIHFVYQNTIEDSSLHRLVYESINTLFDPFQTQIAAWVRVSPVKAAAVAKDAEYGLRKSWHGISIDSSTMEKVVSRRCSWHVHGQGERCVDGYLKESERKSEAD